MDIFDRLKPMKLNTIKVGGYGTGEVRGQSQHDAKADFKGISKGQGTKCRGQSRNGQGLDPKADFQMGMSKGHRTRCRGQSRDGQRYDPKADFQKYQIFNRVPDLLFASLSLSFNPLQTFL